MTLRNACTRVAVIAGLGTATAAAMHCSVLHARSSGDYGIGALPAIPFLEALALGYREAAADVAWMRAAQYYGEHRQGGNDLSFFAHYLDAVTTLDPRYEHAYLLGAAILATDGGDLEAGLRLLRRGARALPHSGEIEFEMGFLSFVAGGEPQTARLYFARAARHPLQRARAQRFQAFIDRKLGHLETALALWIDVYEHSDSDAMRQVAAANVRRVRVQLGAERR